jgi:DNA mismatch repair protein MutS
MTGSMSNAIYTEYERYVLQYQKEYGDRVVVFLQCGSFFEVYSCGDDLFDIKSVAEVLNMVLTKKNKSIQDVSRSNCLMVGFPTYTLMKYVSVLLEHDYTVVVVEQVTPAPQPRREVTHVFSPGTTIDDIAPTHNNYVMSIFVEEMRDWRSQKCVYHVGVAYIDVSTGKSYALESSGKPDDVMYAFDEAYRVILATEPREVILFGNASSMSFEAIRDHLALANRCVHLTGDRYDECLGKLPYQSQFLAKVFPGHGLLSPVEYVGLERMPLALVSFIAVLRFVFKHSETILEKIERPDVIESSKYLVLSYNSSKQLDIDPLLAIINTCKTAIGKRLFKHRLLNPRTDRLDLERSYDRVDFFLSASCFKSVQPALSGISDVERQFRRVLVRKLAPSEMGALIASVAGIAKLASSLPDYGITAQEVGELSGYLSAVDAQEAGKYALDTIAGNVFVKGQRLDADAIQDKMTDQIALFDLVCEHFNRDNRFFRVEQNDKDGYYLAVTSKRFATFKKDTIDFVVMGLDFRVDDLSVISSAASGVKLGHPLFKSANDQIQQCKVALKDRVTRHYIEFLDGMSRFQGVFARMVDFVGNVDVACANAQNAERFGYTRPVVSDDHGDKSFVLAEQLRHPIVERTQHGIEYVANDVALGTDSTSKGMLLYGINAAGKSSLMKSVGLAVVMASAGMYVPASSFVFHPFQYLFTRIPNGDNIARGQSTFTNEIGELRNILKRANQNSLVIGDELCSGTEQVSAMAIVAAGIVTLCERAACFIFATHLHGLPDLPSVSALSASDLRICHLSVEFDENDGKLVYDRRLKAGPGTTMYGLEVCKALDLDKEFIALAYGIRRGILDQSADVVATKKSRYNARMYMDSCSICKKKCTDTHHIREQRVADKNGMIGRSHKNALHNLVALCEACHDAVHKGTLRVGGYVQTSRGVELEFERV